MKILSGILSLILLMSCHTSNPNKKNIQSLMNVEGTWIMMGKRNIIGEKWIAVDKEQLIGFGFIIKGSDTIKTEQFSIRKNGNDIAYTSIAFGQNNNLPVSFRLTSHINNVFVFENPDHDFPKRITYHLVNKDSIHAFIDAGSDKPGKKQDFFYSRAE